MAFSSKGSNQTIDQLSERFSTDRYGVDTMELVVKIPDSLFPQQILADFSPHPRFSNLLLSKRNGQRSEPGWWTVSYTFEGFINEEPEEPTYELVGSLSQEPIQTHPDFATIAGTPASPLNGAIFIDPDTLRKSESVNAIFKEFTNVNGATNPKAGVDSYLEPSVEWRETRFSTSRPTTLTGLGNIQTPNGSPPDLSPRNWLYWSESYIRRGGVYQITSTWKLSGRNGWDPDIYDTE